MPPAERSVPHRTTSLPGVALHDEAVTESLTSLKAERDRLIEKLRRRLSDPGNAGVPHHEFIANRPRLR
jgi:hypothetical protein